MAAPDHEVLQVDGREIKISNPGKVFFPTLGATKLDLALYYQAVAEGALAGARNRPTTLYRWPNGVTGEGFFQKRVPPGPDWLKTAVVRFPSGRFAEMLVLADAAH